MARSSCLLRAAAVLAAFSLQALAVPRDFANLIVINPKITAPNAQTVWTAGTTETCTWDTSGVTDPNVTGSLLLGYLDEGSSGENLDRGHPLASGFHLTDGEVAFPLPANLTARTSYIVVLMGDSGNASPPFTIRSAADGA